MIFVKKQTNKHVFVGNCFSLSLSGVLYSATEDSIIILSTFIKISTVLLTVDSVSPHHTLCPINLLAAGASGRTLCHCPVGPSLI